MGRTRTFFGRPYICLHVGYWRSGDKFSAPKRCSRHLNVPGRAWQGWWRGRHSRLRKVEFRCEPQLLRAQNRCPSGIGDLHFSPPPFIFKSSPAGPRGDLTMITTRCSAQLIDHAECGMSRLSAGSWRVTNMRLLRCGLHKHARIFDAGTI